MENEIGILTKTKIFTTQNILISANQEVFLITLNNTTQLNSSLKQLTWGLFAPNNTVWLNTFLKLYIDNEQNADFVITSNDIVNKVGYNNAGNYLDVQVYSFTNNRNSIISIRTNIEFYKFLTIAVLAGNENITTYVAGIYEQNLKL